MSKLKQKKLIQFWLIIFSGFICSSLTSIYSNWSMQSIRPLKSHNLTLSKNVLVERNQQRLKQLHRTCQELKKNKKYFKTKGYIVSSKNLSHSLLLMKTFNQFSPGFLVNSKRNVAYCGPAKSGTTTWNLAFLKFGDEDISEYEGKSTGIIHGAAAKKFGTHQVSEANKHFLFTFVRHPFLRFISVYQNKILDGDNRKTSKFARTIRKRVPDMKPTFSQEKSIF